MADDKKDIAGAMPAIGIGMDIANAVGGWFGGNKRQEQQYEYPFLPYRDWETDRKSVV